MKPKIFRTIAAFMICMLVSCCFAVTPVSASSKKYSMPTSVTVYDYSNGHYKKIKRVKLKYNKKNYLSEVKAGSTESKLSYRIKKNGKLKRIKIREFRDGKINHFYQYTAKGYYAGPTDYKYVYSKKGLPVTAYLLNDNDPDERYKEISLTYDYYNNGIIKHLDYVQMTDPNCFGEGEEGEGYTDRRAADFNKKGLVTMREKAISGIQSEEKYFYKYLKDNKGRIKTIIVEGEFSCNAEQEIDYGSYDRWEPLNDSESEIRIGKERQIIGKYVLKYKNSPKTSYLNRWRAVINGLTNIDDPAPLIPAVQSHLVFPENLCRIIDFSTYKEVNEIFEKCEEVREKE